MKKLLIFILVLLSPYLIWVLLRLLTCHPDKHVYEVSLPLAEAVVKHVEKYGRPNDLKDVENHPYELIPCSEKPKDFFCEDYYFEKDDKLYTAYLLDSSKDEIRKSEMLWVSLNVEHGITYNKYSIINPNKIATIDTLEVSIGYRFKGICAHFSF